MHNVQLKGEVARYKRKYTKKGADNTKLQRECAELRAAEIRALQAKKEALGRGGEVREEGPEGQDGREGEEARVGRAELQGQGPGPADRPPIGWGSDCLLFKTSVAAVPSVLGE